MNRLGGLILIAGIIGLIAALGMDTSVPSALGGRINNIGLMKDQQNYIMISGLMVLAGLILIVVQSRASGSDPNGQDGNQTKTCPECAEAIKADAKVCRFCGNRDFPEAATLEQSRKTLFDILVWDRTMEPPRRR